MPKPCEIRRVSETEGRNILSGFNLPVILWVSSRLSNGKYEAILADYRGLAGYDPLVAVAVYNRNSGAMCDRFNVRFA